MVEIQVNRQGQNCQTTIQRIYTLVPPDPNSKKFKKVTLRSALSCPTRLLHHPPPHRPLRCQITDQVPGDIQIQIWKQKQIEQRERERERIIFRHFHFFLGLKNWKSVCDSERERESVQFTAIQSNGCDKIWQLQFQSKPQTPPTPHSNSFREFISP